MTDEIKLTQEVDGRTVYLVMSKEVADIIGTEAIAELWDKVLASESEGV